MDIKRTVIGIIYDEMICKLDASTKSKAYVFKEIRKISRKHHKISAQDVVAFNKAYKLANEAWLSAQKEIRGNGLEYSVVLLLKSFRDENDWLGSYFGLSEKSSSKMEAGYDLSKHILRTKKVVNAINKHIDIVVAQHNYREENK